MDENNLEIENIIYLKKSYQSYICYSCGKSSNGNIYLVWNTIEKHRVIICLECWEAKE